MATPYVSHEEPVLVAIGVSKARHEILMAVPDKKRRPGLTVQNRLDDYTRLSNSLLVYDRPVRIALEARVTITVLWLIALEPRFEIKRVSSVAQARTHEALNNS